MKEFIETNEKYIIQRYFDNRVHKKKFTEGEVDIAVVESLIKEQVIRLFAEQLDVNICVYWNSKLMRLK